MILGLETAAAVLAGLLLAMVGMGAEVNRHEKREHKILVQQSRVELLPRTKGGKELQALRTYFRHNTCKGCRNWHGQIYGSNLLVCAIYPRGPEAKPCWDWEADSPEL